MVRDGIYYGLGMLAIAGLVGYFTVVWLAAVPVLLALFFMWFFRDPERTIPQVAGGVVSPADGKVTDVSPVPGGRRISIFLNVFDVHVNRSPIAGSIQKVEYRRGEFRNAMDAASADANEQNIVTVEGEGHTVVFKQIAGLIARRIVFNKKIGDAVGRGERIGLIKFGSRTDVVLPEGSEVRVKVGERVRGGATLIAVLPGKH